MVNEQLRIDAEQLIQQILIVKPIGIPNGTPGNIAHGIQAVFLQFFGVPPAHTPEIRQRTVVPQQPPVGHFVQLGDADTVLVRLYMLRHNIHGNLAQIQIGADSGSGCDAGDIQHILNDLPDEFIGSQSAVFQVRGHIHEHLVNGIDMDILRGHIFQINLINFGAVFHIMGHSGRRHNIIHRQGRIGIQGFRIPGGACKTAAGSFLPPQGIDLLHLLHRFKKPCPAGNSIGLQRRRHRKADGLFRAAGIGYQEICGQGIQFPLNALHRGIERLQVDGCIYPLFGHFPRLLLKDILIIKHPFAIVNQGPLRIQGGFFLPAGI